MIQSITGVALRFFRANKLITISSILTVALSTTLILTMVNFSTNARTSMENEMKQLYGEMDLSVGFNSDQSQIMDQELLQRIISSEGVSAFSPVFITFSTIDQNLKNVQIIGVENDDLAKSRYPFHGDIAKDEIVITQNLADLLQVSIHDQITIENQSFTVKELIAEDVSAGSMPKFMILARESAQKLPTQDDAKEATYLLLQTDQDPLSVAERIRHIDPELRIDIAEENELMQKNLVSLNGFIVVLAVLILIVSGLLLISNFDIFLYNYRHQLAVMRSIGAHANQLSKIGIIQLSVMNVSGALLGLALTVVTNSSSQILFEKLFPFEVSHYGMKYVLIIPTLVAITVVIQLFSLFLHYKLSKILPLAIMRGNEKVDFAVPKARKIISMILLVLSVCAIWIGAHAKGENTSGPILLGVILLITSLFLLLPIVLPFLLTQMLPLFKKIFGQLSFVAVKNLIPQVRKNTFVILVISVMMMIAVFGTAFLETIQKNDRNYVKSLFPTEIILTSQLDKSSIDPMELRGELEKIPVIEHASVIGRERFNDSFAMEKEGEYVGLSVLLSDLKELEMQGLLHGISDQGKDEIIISDTFASEHNLDVGSVINLASWKISDEVREIPGKGWYIPEGVSYHTVLGVETVRVTKIIKQFPGYRSDFSLIADWKNESFQTNNYGDIAVAQIYISGVNEQEVLGDLTAIKRKYPELKISQYSESVAASDQMFYQRWAIFIVVMGILLVGTMLGVLNTLMTNINQKRKEYAILRAVSVTKKGIIQIILSQVMLYLMIGIVFGTMLGVLLTYAMNLIDPGPVYFNIPFISAIAGTMVLLTFVIFTVIASRIGGLNVSTELSLDL